MAEGEIKVTGLEINGMELKAKVDWKIELPPPPPDNRILMVVMMVVMLGLGILIGRAL